MKNKTMKKVIAMATVAAMGITAIVPASQAEAAVKAKKLTVKTKKITLYKGAAAGYGSVKLKVTVKPKKAKVTYKINKKKIASVSKKGLVKAKKPGKAKITVKSGSKKVVVKVVVKKIKKKVTKITAPSELTVNVGEKQKITTSVKPKKATLKKLAFSSDTKTVAKVSAKGVVTGVTAGNAKITVKAVDGSKKKATVAVVVTGGAVATTGPAVSTGPAATATATAEPGATEAAPTATPVSSFTTVVTSVPSADGKSETTTLSADTTYKMSFGTDDSALSSLELNKGTMQVFNEAVTKLVENDGNLTQASETFKTTEYNGTEFDGLSITKAKDATTAVVKSEDKTYDLAVETASDVVSVSMTNTETSGDSLSLKATQNSDGTYNVTDLEVAGVKASGDFTATTSVDSAGATTMTLTNGAGDTYTISYSETSGMTLDIPTAAKEKYNIGFLQ